MSLRDEIAAKVKAAEKDTKRESMERAEIRMFRDIAKRIGKVVGVYVYDALGEDDPVEEVHSRGAGTLLEHLRVRTGWVETQDLLLPVSESKIYGEFLKMAEEDWHVLLVFKWKSAGTACMFMDPGGAEVGSPRIMAYSHGMADNVCCMLLEDKLKEICI
jgi:hypothetical protein